MATTTTAEAQAMTRTAARVLRGMALLDRERPGWPAMAVDVERLDMSSQFKCVPAQVEQWATGHKWATFFDALETLGLTWDEAEKFGFDATCATAPGGDVAAEARRLTEVWRLGIVWRRAETAGLT